MPQIDKYTAGTVTLTNGSATVAGNATNWISGGLYSVVAGHWFRYGSFTSLIVAVNSATSITLADAYGGSTASGLSYEVYRYTRLETPEAVGFLQSLLARGSNTNPFTRVDLDSGSVRASFRDDGTGQLGWYVGTTGAADGSQVKAATVNKSNGNVVFPAGLHAGSASAQMGAASASFSSGAYVHGSGAAYWQTYNSSAAADEKIWRVGCVGGDFFFQGVNDGYTAVTVTPMVLSRSGNVGVGTTTPGARLNVAVADDTVGFLVAGASKAIRFVASSAKSVISGFDNTGIGSLQPLELAASTLGFVTSGGLAMFLDGSRNVLAGSDNAQTLGGASNRWSVVYAGTGTINTSDARAKTPIRPLNATELRAAQRLAMEIGVYQWLEAVKEKGDAARQHIGMTVQRAIEIMEEEGLDPWAYGFMCRDQITRKVKVMQKRMVAKVEEVEVSYTEIEVRDGVPVQVTKTRTDKQPVMQMVAVRDEAGKPVLREIAPVEGEAEAETPKKGKRAKPTLEPVMHSVPVMVEEEVEAEVDEPAGDRLGFRPDQIDRFIMRGLAEKIALLEAK